MIASTGRRPIERKGIVQLQTLRSRALGISKKYNVYLPPGYSSSRLRYPVLYLFRGHEREWVNPREDASRAGSTVADVLDSLLAADSIKPMIVVMPGLSSDDNSIPGLGINMRQPSRARGREGIGSGRFEDYLIGELLPAVDRKFRTIAKRTHRAVDGFSLGGYTAMLCAARHPDLFASAGCYDGTHMWRGFEDPRDEEGIDRAWMLPELFDAAFGKPRQRDFMRRYNPTDIIAAARGRHLAQVQRIMFHVQAAAFDGQRGNLDRARHFVSVLETAGITNSFRDVILTPAAVHNWRYADLHMKRVLPKHDAVFRANGAAP